MKKNLLSFKALSLVLLIIGLLIIIITTYIYLKHSHISFLGDLDSNLFGEFGEFIGGVVGTIFNLVVIVLLWLTYLKQQEELIETKTLIKTQINLSLKPDLFVIDSQFSVFSKLNNLGKSFPLEFTREQDFNNETEDPKIISTAPNINIVNVGVAVAKYVEFNWSYNLQIIIDYLKEYYDTDDFDLEVEPNRAHAKIGIKSQASHYINYFQKDRFDILLPYKSPSDFKQLVFPEPYLACYSIAFHLYLTGASKSNNKEFLTNFPKCFLELNYLDIANNFHKKNFSFKIENDNLYNRVTNQFEKMFGGTFIGVEDPPLSL